MQSFFVFLVLASSAAIGAPQQDGETTVSQDAVSCLVTIGYGFKGEPAIVTLDIQTNGPSGYVSIDQTSLTNLMGDVNRVVTPGLRKQILWQPLETMSGRVHVKNVRAVVTLHATNSPPDYVVIDLKNDRKSMRFYPNAGQIPNGVTDDIYKTRYYVMRRMHAAGVVWPMGVAKTQTARNSDTENQRPWVAIPEDYYIGIYPCTMGHFRQNGTLKGVVNDHCTFKDEADSDLLPVHHLMFYNIRGQGDTWPNSAGVYDKHIFPQTWAYPQFIRNVIGTKFLLDLPTEAQWEFACRAGNYTDVYYNGGNTSNDLEKIAWHVGNVSKSRPQPVGLKDPNDWGLYDMCGNVWDLCLDLARSDYGVGRSDYDDVNFFGPAKDLNNVCHGSSLRVIRGGGYKSDYRKCTSSSRSWVEGTAESDSVGMRLAMPACYPYAD